VVRLDREGDRPLVRAEFEAWLAGDRRRRGAYARAAAAWTLLDRAEVLPDAAWRGPVVSRRVMVAGAAAAVVLAAGGGTALMLSRTSRSVYRTALGEMRRIPLEDGSVMMLNSASLVQVAMGRRSRRLKLIDGEAWFQVAKDMRRPFLVETEASQVRAVGTAFSVRRRNGSTEVLVTEGVVELRDPSAAADPVKLPAGSRASMEMGGALRTASLSQAEMERSLAWREGQIALDGDTLGEAVEQFNRYNHRQLVVANPELARAKLVGWFWLDDPDSFAGAAARTLGAEIRLRDNQIVLISRR
jgi:transmembrane sensor